MILRWLKLQMQLLPRDVKLPCLICLIIPAMDDLSGDMVNIFQVDKSVLIYIADVSGHGVSAQCLPL